MRASIRRTLLVWYSVILLTVLGGFSAALYQWQRRNVYAAADDEVASRAHALARFLERQETSSPVRIPDEHVRWFGQAGRDAPWFAVWDAEGMLVARSPSVEAARARPHAGWLRRSGQRRELAVNAPRGFTVVVGRGTGKAGKALHRFAKEVAAVAAGTFALALLGGWLLVGRVLRPIDRIAAAAASISESNLSRRIDVGRTETELGRLAATLNDTFARLELAFERQRRFTADASHELRTPLAIQMSTLQVALDRPRSDAEYRDALEVCLRAARRMRSTVEELLELARADGGDIRLARERLDLKPLVAETVALFQPLADERRLRVRLAGARAKVMGDAARLRQVVSNLLSNAIRYEREGGSIDVSVSASQGRAVLVIRDTGIGIPEGDLPRVFERFYRADKARSRDVGGSGLGLAITKWLVEAHGGTIALASREGEGTTVTVRLPEA